MNNSTTSNNINVLQREYWLCLISGEVIKSVVYFERLKADQGISPPIGSSPVKRDMEIRSKRLKDEWVD